MEVGVGRHTVENSGRAAFAEAADDGDLLGARKLGLDLGLGLGLELGLRLGLGLGLGGWGWGLGFHHATPHTYYVVLTMVLHYSPGPYLPWCHPTYLGVILLGIILLTWHHPTYLASSYLARRARYHAALYTQGAGQRAGGVAPSTKGQRVRGLRRATASAASAAAGREG